MFLLHFKFADRLVPQFFPLLELLCALNQKILCFCFLEEFLFLESSQRIFGGPGVVTVRPSRRLLDKPARHLEGIESPRMSHMRNPTAMFHQMQKESHQNGRGRRRRNIDMALLSRFMEVTNSHGYSEATAKVMDVHMLQKILTEIFGQPPLPKDLYWCMSMGDRNKSGDLSFRELKLVFNKYVKYKEEADDILALIKRHDKDEDCQLDDGEMQALLMEAVGADEISTTDIKRVRHLYAQYSKADDDVNPESLAKAISVWNNETNTAEDTVGEKNAGDINGDGFVLPSEAELMDNSPLPKTYTSLSRQSESERAEREKSEMIRTKAEEERGRQRRELLKSRIIFECWAYKSGKGGLLHSDAYKKRYFVITDQQYLNYYEGSEEYYQNRPKGSLSCVDMLVKNRNGMENIEGKVCYTCTIRANGQTRDFHFAFETTDRRLKFLEAIDNVQKICFSKWQALELEEQLKKTPSAVVQLKEVCFM